AGAALPPALTRLLAATTAAAGAEGLPALMGGPPPPGERGLRGVFSPFAALGLLYLPVFMMFWFSPPLVAWHATGPARALFFSFVACLMNWRAFLAYGAAALLVMAVVPALALLALRILFPVELKAAAVSLVFPLLVVLLPTLFSSFYASYRDVFADRGQ